MGEVIGEAGGAQYEVYATHGKPSRWGGGLACWWFGRGRARAQAVHTLTGNREAQLAPLSREGSSAAFFPSTPACTPRPLTPSPTSQHCPLRQVIRANETMYKAGQMERVILRKLSEADPEGKRHCIRQLGSFEYRNHLCLVFEPMVSAVQGRRAVGVYASGLLPPDTHLCGCRLASLWGPLPAAHEWDLVCFKQARPHAEPEPENPLTLGLHPKQRARVRPPATPTPPPTPLPHPHPHPPPPHPPPPPPHTHTPPPPPTPPPTPRT